MSREYIKQELFWTTDENPPINLSKETAPGFVYHALRNSSGLRGAYHQEFFDDFLQDMTSVDVDEGLEKLQEESIVCNKGDYWALLKIYDSVNYTEIFSGNHQFSGPRKKAKAEVRYIKTEMGLTEDVVEKSDEMIKDLPERILAGNRPKSNAAGLIYAAGIMKNDKRTQEQVADAAEVSKMTISERYQTFIAALGIHDGGDSKSEPVGSRYNEDETEAQKKVKEWQEKRYQDAYENQDDHSE